MFTYLVIGLGAGEVETGVALLVDEEVGEVNLCQKAHLNSLFGVFLTSLLCVVIYNLYISGSRM